MLEKKESFKDAYEELERLSRDPEKRWAYEMAFKALKDEEVRLIDRKKAEQMQLDKAMQKGMQQGMQQGINESMNILYQKGFTVEQIADLYDMSVESIRKVIRSSSPD